MADVSRLDYLVGQALPGLVLREALEERDDDPETKGRVELHTPTWRWKMLGKQQPQCWGESLKDSGHSVRVAFPPAVHLGVSSGLGPVQWSVFSLPQRFPFGVGQDCDCD